MRLSYPSSLVVVIWIFLGTLLFPGVVHAQFGVSSKNKKSSGAAGETTVQKQDDTSLDWDSLVAQDPELADAMTMFAAMNTEERMELMTELSSMFEQDAETLSLLQEVFSEVANMPQEDVQTTLQDLVQEDEVTAAMADTLRLLQNADESTWETIFERRSDILEAVILSGQISEEDAARFRANDQEWEAELKFIWTQLKQQAQHATDEL